MRVPATPGAAATVTGSASPPAPTGPVVIGGSGTGTPNTQVAVVGLSGTVTVKEYGGNPNPAASLPFRSAGAYFDVRLGGPTLTFSASLTVSRCAGVQAGDSLYWFNAAAGPAGAWQPVRPGATVVGGCLETTLSANSSPSLSELSGTPFAVALAFAAAPPTLTPAPVTVGGVSAQVVGDLGYNPVAAIEAGLYAGYVEERAAIEAGASFAGEGIDSSYLADILSGDGVGLEQHVSAIQQGQFAALYQRLGIIPTWTGTVVTPTQAIAALIKAGASALAIENYLVQIDGFGWATAQPLTSWSATSQAAR